MSLSSMNAFSETTIVVIEPVVVQDSTGFDSVLDPPLSAAEITAGRTFLVELWAQQTDPSLDGLACVFSDLTFANDVVSCVGVTPTPGFVAFARGLCDNQRGVVHTVGGCTFQFPGPGIAPEWVRVATVTMEAESLTESTFVASSAGDLAVSIAFFGEVSGDSVHFGSSTDIRIEAAAGDLDLDGDADLGDFAALVDCLSGPSANGVSGRCDSALFDLADADNDADVDLEDVASWIAALVPS